jgi:hypothetical protein
VSDDDDLLIEQLAAGLDVEWTDEALDDRDGADEMIGPAVVNWRDIADEDRPEACAALVAWVQDWLVPRYYLTNRDGVPDCWWQHTDLVEELSALHIAWEVAFDPADGGFGPIGWHERFALARTRPAFRQKCADEHRAVTAREMPAVTEPF